MAGQNQTMTGEVSKLQKPLINLTPSEDNEEELFTCEALLSNITTMPSRQKDIDQSDNYANEKANYANEGMNTKRSSRREPEVSQATRPRSNTSGSLFRQILQQNQLILTSLMSESFTGDSSDEQECIEDTDNPMEISDGDDRSINDDPPSETVQTLDSLLNTETAPEQDMLSSLMDFNSNEEKSGPQISDNLAKLVNAGLRSKTDDDKMKELTDKHHKPENCQNLKVSKVNPGIWKQMSTTARDTDAKLQRGQFLQAKAIVPVLYLVDMLLKHCKAKTPLNMQEVNEAYNLALDTYKLSQLSFTDLTFRRRYLIQKSLSNSKNFSELFGKDTPVTDHLFGDNVKQLVDKIDAETTLGKKLRGDRKYTTSSNSKSAPRNTYGHGYSPRFKPYGYRSNQRQDGGKPYQQKAKRQGNFLDQRQSRKKFKE